MFDNLDVFKMSAAMAQHAGRRQAVVAQNVANADTPGFVARDLPAFKDVYTTAGAMGPQRATRAGHMHGQQQTQLASVVRVGADGAPNGNQVSLETEMLHSVEAKRHHSRAVSIYKSSLGILRSTLRK